MEPLFKAYDNTTPIQLDLNSLIPENHSSRIINEVVNNLDIGVLIGTYKGGGTTSYNPRMMLKLIFYGYLNNIYSCRKLEKAAEENIHFIWLCGGQRPDFRTINTFRSERLKESIELLFSYVVKIFVEIGSISIKEQFIDGTKIEANANKYSFVWKKSVEKNKAKLEAKIKLILADISKLVEDEHTALTLTENSQREEPLTSEELKTLLKKINDSKKKPVQKKKRRK